MSTQRSTRLPKEQARLLREFRQVLQHSDTALPVQTDAIMVLAVRPDQDADGGYARHDTPENRARIGWGVHLVRAVAAARPAGRSPGPLLILNGEDEQFPMMTDVALEFGAPRDLLVEVACGTIGSANTRIQFEVLHQEPWLGQLRHLTVVTTGYHAPRVRRTAQAQLPATLPSTVFAAPYQAYPFSVFKIRGEIRRILAYAARGDIADCQGEDDF